MFEAKSAGPQGLPQCHQDEGDLDKVLAYLVDFDSFEFKDFVAAASIWRQDRPALLYPEVIKAMSGEEHDYKTCFDSGECEADPNR